MHICYHVACRASWLLRPTLVCSGLLFRPMLCIVCAYSWFCMHVALCVCSSGMFVQPGAPSANGFGHWGLWWCWYCTCPPADQLASSCFQQVWWGLSWHWGPEGQVGSLTVISMEASSQMTTRSESSTLHERVMQSRYCHSMLATLRAKAVCYHCWP